MSKIIKITPEMNKRVQSERRREPRERIADAERRLKQIFDLVEAANWDNPEPQLCLKIYRLAGGR